MGNSASKTVPITVKQLPNLKEKAANFDSNFGRQIMQNIKLKESPASALNQKKAAVSSNLRKRMELDKQMEGTISWHDFPSIFTHEQDKIDPNKVKEIKKYFSLPIKK